MNQRREDIKDFLLGMCIFIGGVWLLVKGVHWLVGLFL